MFMHFHAYIPSYFYHLILKLLSTLLIVSLSFFLSLPLTLVASWHLSISLFRPGILFVLGHLLLLLLLTPFPLTWFHDEKAKSNFFENFSRRGIHSKSQVVLSDFSNIDLPTVIYSRGWESLCGTSVTCPSVIIQYAWI